MFDLTYTDEQRAQAETARQFAREKIAPQAGRWDEEGHFPKEELRQAWELGLMNCEVPEQYGGLGLSCLSHTLIQEEIAWACTGCNTSMAGNMLGAMPIIIAGTEEQKQRYLG